VSGSALLTDVLATHERARVQASADLIVNLASAAGSLGSGVLIKSLGYGTVAMIGAGLALVAVAAVIKIQLARPVKMIGQTP
jgi:predicted MFS family arabinose efflux permease